jgi:ankyrin repeat protein
LLPRTVDLLIRYGAKVKDELSSFTPVIDACRAAYGLDDKDTALLVCNLLLNAGADVDALGPKKETALMFASSTELTKLLLCHGANIDAVDEDGIPETGFSALFGNVGSVELLVQAGVNPNEGADGALLGIRHGGPPGTDEDRLRILDFALWAGASPTKFLFFQFPDVPSSAIQKVLWYGASTNQADEHGLLPIQHAHKEGASPAVLSLLAPHDGYRLTDPKTNKSMVIAKTDPGPPRFTTYELDFDFCAHCRREVTT